MDAFEIGVSLIMSGNALDFMTSFVEKLGLAHSGIDKLQGQLEHTKRLAMGLGAVFVGYETFKGLLHLAEHGKELNHQQSMLLRNGIAYKDVIDETTRAYQRYTQQVPTASGPDFLRTANELVSVKGTLAGADQALVQSLKIEGLIGNTTGKSAEGQGYDFWRTVEDKGIIQNKEKTDTWLNAMVQGTMATGGKIGGPEWYQYARKAMTSWNTDALESLPLQLMEMQTLTAPTAGADRRMFARMIEGGQKLSHKQEDQFRSVGMLDDAGRIQGRDLEVSRPDMFIDQTIKKLREHGIIGEEAVKGWATRAFNASSAAYFMTAYAGMSERDPATGLTRLEKERNNLGRAQGLDQAYSTMMGTDMTANLSALSKQWQSFMEAVGGPLAKAAIPALQTATDVVNKMAAFADKHQTLTTVIGELTAAGAGLLALSGGITAIKAALAIKSAINNGTAAASAGVAGLGLDWSKGTPIPPATPGFAMRALNFMGGVLPPIMAYEAGKSIISTGLDALPHPNYPAGYDPQAIRNGGVMGDLSRLKQDVQPLIDGAEKALREGFGSLNVGPSVQAGMAKIGAELTSAFATLPAQVEGGIKAAVGSIGASLAGALASLGKMNIPGAKGLGSGAVVPDPGAIGPMRYQGPTRGGTGGHTVQVHTAIYLDRRQQQRLADVVSSHQARGAQFARSIGGADTYGHFTNPGTPIPDVA